MCSRLLTAFLVALSIPLTAFAQPLADRVPQDAVIYVGWRGSTSLGPGYEGSHLKAVLEASGLPEFFARSLPQALNEIGRQDREAAQVIAAFSEIGRSAWQHPTALFVGPIDWDGGPRGPQPRAGLLCDAGADAGALEGRIRDLVLQVQREAPFEIRTFRHANLVGVVVGYREADFAGEVINGRSLGDNAAFKGAIGRTQKDPVFVAYVNAEAARRAAEDVIARAGDADVAREWPRVRDALGLGGLQQVAFTAGFREKGWESNVFVGAPRPRKGVLALLDAKPVSDDALKLIPASAQIAGALSFDPAQLLNEFRSVVREIEPRAVGEIDKGLQEISHELGVDVEHDLLGGLGNEWAYYASPAVAGNGVQGLVLVNRLKDPAKAQRALGGLSEAVNRIAAREHRDVRIGFRKMQADGLEITYLATPIVAPAWAVKDNNLYVALYPQTVAAAAKQAGQSQTILENPAFAELRKSLAGENAAQVSSVQFMDLPKLAPAAYPGWLTISRLAGFADLQGIPVPPMLLPPLQTLTDHLTPAGAATWSDDAGWHARAFTPFPGASLLSTNVMP
jgi:hypothetical protein